MAIQSIGLISSEDINLELGRAANAPFSLTGTEERALAGIPSGTISFSDFYGKSSGIVYEITIGSNGSNTIYGYDYSGIGSVSPFIANGIPITRAYTDSNNEFRLIFNGYVPIGDIQSVTVTGLGGQDPVTFTLGDETYYAASSTSTSTLIHYDLPNGVSPWSTETTAEVKVNFNKKYFINSSFVSGITGPSGLIQKIGYSDGSFHPSSSSLPYGLDSIILDGLEYRITHCFTTIRSTPNNYVYLGLEWVGHNTPAPLNLLDKLVLKQTASYFPTTFPEGSPIEYLFEDCLVDNSTNLKLTSVRWFVDETLDETRPCVFQIT